MCVPGAASKPAALTHAAVLAAIVFAAAPGPIAVSPSVDARRLDPVRRTALIDPVAMADASPLRLFSGGR
jgi:hypothetical protein